MRASARMVAAVAAATPLPSKARLTTNIVGGMGNQLFLVANLLATAHRTGIPAYVEAAPLSSSAEGPRPTYWDTLFRDLSHHGVQLCAPSPPLPVVTVPETRPVRKIELDAQRACVFNMIGFFQSVAFFDDYPMMASVIPQELWDSAREHLTTYYGGGSCHTVALHVRRGDYTRFTDIFEQLDVVDYYDVAVRQLLGGLLVQSPSRLLPQSSSGDSPRAPTAGAPPLLPLQILVFCDEERFGRTVVGYFRTKYTDAVTVSLVCAKTEEAAMSARPTASTSLSSSAPVMPRDVLELLMMSQCNDIVMANSTFSWWAAYLNRTSLRRVIAPSRWFVKDPYPASNHLYCPGWVLI
ncbi:hypothetical protein, conserved [Leishmania tarentolae]|uniref:Glycosyl transferase family 11 n=1 Tax=Leishmania tarentolae TaxID=5689 RepID=A0A640K730_LEITA|nr:hypothetical protein, conserved [Leishmania tarentolae]